MPGPPHYKAGGKKAFALIPEDKRWSTVRVNAKAPGEVLGVVFMHSRKMHIDGEPRSNYIADLLRTGVLRPRAGPQAARLTAPAGDVPSPDLTEPRPPDADRGSCILGPSRRVRLVSQ